MMGISAMDKRDSCNYRKASQFREVAGTNTVSQRSLSPLGTGKQILCRCSTMAVQMPCKHQVKGSNPFIGFATAQMTGISAAR